VLDSRYLPVNVISWFRAVVMDGSGKVGWRHLTSKLQTAFHSHNIVADPAAL
jgi:hypothetical protein